jgi:hypothetical protein
VKEWKRATSMNQHINLQFTCGFFSKNWLYEDLLQHWLMEGTFVQILAKSMFVPTSPSYLDFPRLSSHKSGMRWGGKT